MERDCGVKVYDGCKDSKIGAYHSIHEDAILLK